MLEFLQLYKKHQNYLHSLVGEEFEELPENMFRLNVYGEVVSAESFEYDDLHVQYLVDIPGSWSCDPSKVDLRSDFFVLGAVRIQSELRKSQLIFMWCVPAGSKLLNGIMVHSNAPFVVHTTLPPGIVVQHDCTYICVFVRC